MPYEYLGYLKTILGAAETQPHEEGECIVFTADDIVRWNTKDLESHTEWNRIPVHRARTAEGVRLTGQFEDIRRIDILSVDDPSFWVPLTSIGVEDHRFPIDLTKYPIVELTYRCLTEQALPGWGWTYPGGVYLERVPPTRQWNTVACLVPHLEFPKQVDGIVLRLYSSRRTTESVEIQSLRFRAMTATEREACARDRLYSASEAKPKRYPVLDEFLPLGVWMDAEAARRLAEMLGISLAEYWELAFEDIVLHQHNCVAFEGMDQLSPDERRELIRFARTFGLKLVVTHDTRPYETAEQKRAFLDTHIKPFANQDDTGNTILAWGLAPEVNEQQFKEILDTKALVEEADPFHPTFFETRHPSAFPLYAAFFPIASMSHYTSHAPWEFGEVMRTHAPLCKGQHFWVNAPAFVYATGSPDWSTCPELRLMMNLSFATGTRGWFSYAYHSDPLWLGGSCQRSLTGPFLAFSDLWQELTQRASRFNALAPLLLRASPLHLPGKWYVTNQTSGDNRLRPDDVPPTSSFRLRGEDFNLYSVISNDIRGMSSLNVSIPPKDVKGFEIYDVSDFVHERQWVPMNLERHLEMFPGQGRIVLVAEPRVCQYWRDQLSKRLIELDQRHLSIHLNWARIYDLPIGPIEKMVEGVGNGEAGTGRGDAVQDLMTLDRARDLLVDLIYDSAFISEARTRINEASAAVCGCDGALCRLVSRGKIDLAREWGLKVVPLAREFTMLRIALRHRQAQAVRQHCDDLVERARALLTKIRHLG